MFLQDIWVLWQNGQTVFHEGKELANAAVWKNRTNLANKLVILLGGLIAIAKVTGYEIEIDEQTLNQVAIGVAAGVAIINNVVHVVTSTKIGFKSATDE